MIKAILMDGDGSTITADNHVPDNLKELILNNSQLKWIMATGRSLELLKKTPIVEFLSTDVVHIVDGGSCLMDVNAGCKKRHLLSKGEIKCLFDKLPLHDINFLYYSRDGINSFMFSNDKNIRQNFKFHDEYVQYTNDINIFNGWINTYPPSKILLNCSKKLDLTGVYYHQNEDNYDITAEGINKGSACLELLEVLNLSADEVLFVFNDKNDLPIVEHPALKDMPKLKVGDHLPEVNVNFHVATPYDVAEVLNQVLKSSEELLD